jgi:putative ABC transport system ATP-binding protein
MALGTEQDLRQGDAGTVLKPSSAPIIQLRDVVKVYETGAGGFTAINGINLDIHRGEFLGIIGKSGAGKTTLLNLISGVSELTSGEVFFYERVDSDARDNGNRSGERKAISVAGMNENELAVWRGNNLGIVYQSFELMPQLNLVKNIMLPQDFLGTYRPRISQEHALELLDRVELLEHAYKLPAHTSGGQKQRIAIARALVNDPPVFIADEPTGNLDTVTSETIFRIFEALVEQGKTIILVTHDNSLASRFSRRVYISDGEVVDSYDQGIYAGLREPSKDAQAIASATTAATAATPAAAAAAAEKRVVTFETGEREGTMPRDCQGNSEPAVQFSEFDAPDAAIVLRDVVKTYVNAAGEFPALKGINLQMCYGQFVSIVGKSGCGKSTLLNMLTGIDHPTSGEVIVGGQNVYDMTESQRALWRGRNVGIVFQFFQLLPMLTLLENTMLPMDYCDVYRPNERPARAMELLAMVGLEEQAHKLPAAVSSGQQQSAAIARALATDPPIIVADEPTGNLDSRSADTILRLFGDMADQGKTILLVTHDPSFTKATDQTVILSDGEIIDELVARALPLLSHPQMLEATHQAEKRQYEPGSVILQQGLPVDHFFMIASGEVDIVLSSPDCPEISLARLGEGQFFGEVELLHSENSIASARAAATGPVEVSLLPKNGFQQLLRGSPSTQEMVANVARMRLDENRAQNGHCEE